MLAFSGGMEKTSGVSPRFRSFDRDQQFLLPPDVRDWLPAGHPALFVTEVVSALDLSGFVSAYQSTEDRGRPAYHPEVMVGIVLYASMVGVLSSRRIERLLATDVVFRVVAANERPDHGTICRFLARHKAALEGLFAQVVGLAAEAGLVDPTVVAVDGTKLAGNASMQRNVELGVLRERFRRWAATVEDNDAAEDAEWADGDGGGGPVDEVFDRDAMREWIRRRLQERHAEPDDRRCNLSDPDSGLLPRSGGGWVQGYNAQAAAVTGGIVVAAAVTASSADATMLAPMVERIATAVQDATGEGVEVVLADGGYWQAATIHRIETDPALPDVLVATARKLPDEPPAPLAEPDLTAHTAAMAAHNQILRDEHARRAAVIARVVNGELLLRQAAQLLGMSIAQVGKLKLDWIAAGGPDGIPVTRITGRTRPTPPPAPTSAGRSRHAMTARLAPPAGKSLYRQRKAIIEPVFGDIKTNRRIQRFLRRGHDAVRAEWHWILTGHNLTILHNAAS